MSKSSFRTKVAVGSNPWTKADPAKMVNLAAICERYGGGGHARVGAISFPPNQEDKAREAAARNCGGVAGEEPGVTRIRQLLNRNCGLQDGPACLEYKDVPPACGKLEPR